MEFRSLLILPRMLARRPGVGVGAAAAELASSAAESAVETRIVEVSK